jgi:hypothetical protein
MYSVKPGRGPSLMAGVAGLVVAGFGVFWCITAASVGAPWFFVGFGVAFVTLALLGSGSSFYNAMSRRRFSSFDVVAAGREPDPLDPYVAETPIRDDLVPGRSTECFCTQCGKPADADHRFCRACGSEIV